MQLWLTDTICYYCNSFKTDIYSSRITAGWATSPTHLPTGNFGTSCYLTGLADKERTSRPCPAVLFLRHNINLSLTTKSMCGLVL